MEPRPAGRVLMLFASSLVSFFMFSTVIAVKLTDSVTRKTASATENDLPRDGNDQPYDGDYLPCTDNTYLNDRIELLYSDNDRISTDNGLLFNDNDQQCFGGDWLHGGRY